MEEIKDANQEVQDNTTQAAPVVDFSFQFKTAKEYEKVENKILRTLKKISIECIKKKKRVGILIVLGNFEPKGDDCVVMGLRQIGTNPIRKYRNILLPSQDDEFFIMLKKGGDGAVIIHKNGQILGSNIYLVVNNPMLEVPDGAGTRHIAAASFSTRDDVLATFTLSEETAIVRVWKSGAFTEQFDPSEEKDEEAE